MKKILLSILLAASIIFSLTSCITDTYAQTGYDADNIDDNISINVVMNYGTPFYYDNVLGYYLYNGWYYYPYFYNDRWFYHRYARPLPPPNWFHGPGPRALHPRYTGYPSRNKFPKPYRNFDRNRNIRPSFGGQVRRNNNFPSESNRKEIFVPKNSNRSFGTRSYNQTPMNIHNRSINSSKGTFNGFGGGHR